MASKATNKNKTTNKQKPASISKHAKLLGKLGGRPKKNEKENGKS